MLAFPWFVFAVPLACSEFRFRNQERCADLEVPPPAPVPLNESCGAPLQSNTGIGSSEPLSLDIEWTYGTEPFCGPPVVGPAMDTNGSGAIDAADRTLVLLMQDGSVHALFGDTGAIAWISEEVGDPETRLALGDVDGDGFPEVVVANDGYVCALRGDSGQTVWCSNPLGEAVHPGGFNHPAIADMNGDGLVEVTVGAAILEGSTGKVRGIGAWGRGGAESSTGTAGSVSVPIDLDRDGLLELVVGNAAYDATGATKWSNGDPDGLVAVADFDGDNRGEIIRVSGGSVAGLETGGTATWEVTIADDAFDAGPPAIDDLDGDGVPDIVVAAGDVIVALDWGGAEKWRQDSSDFSGSAGPVLFDFEGDGYPEVVFADEQTVRILDGRDGSVRYVSEEHSSFTAIETPVVADVDNDGQAEIVIGHCPANGVPNGISVLGAAQGQWSPGRRIWNQHAYHLTNIGDRGDLPATGTPQWPPHNSFRSGDVSLGPGEHLDLVAEMVDVCVAGCGSTVRVAARIGNAGNVSAPAGLPVSLRAGPAGPIVATSTIASALPSGGTSDVIVLVVAAAELEGEIPVVEANVDASGFWVVPDCDPTNDAASGDAAVCGG